MADSVSRVAALGLLAASGMVALGRAAGRTALYRRTILRADARECAAYFAVFSVSLFLWSAQAIYARAFYAAGNTFIPMAAGTVVTLVSWPLYAALYHAHGAMGLAVASDLGIAVQTGAIALLLHQRRMVSLASLDYIELARCLTAGVVSGAGVWLALWGLGILAHRLLRENPGPHLAAQLRWIDLALLVVGSALWLLLTNLVLEKTGSALPRVMRRRLRLG